jgi:signal peptidase I
MSTGTFEDTLRDVLRAGYAARFRVHGDSMHPTIRCGEYLHVAPAPAASFGIGDVVLANTVRGLTAHRIIGMGRDAAGNPVLTTCGDNADLIDSPFPVADVLGIVIAAERNGRRVGIRRIRTISDRIVHSWVRGARKVRISMSYLRFRGLGSASTIGERS